MGGTLSFPLRGPVLGIGVDIVDIGRIAGLRERQGARFLEKVFTVSEQGYCCGKVDPDKHYAVRFAAKEAVSKAFTTGIGERLGWKSVIVEVGERGQPTIALDEQGKDLLREAGGTGVSISLSHSDNQAIAFAALIG